MFLFLLFIDLLKKAKLDFCVKGGIMLNYFLGEHARRTRDIDVYIEDPDAFFASVCQACENSKSPITFQCTWGRKRNADLLFYHNTFQFSVNAYHKEALLKTFTLDGTFGEECRDIETILYPGPAIISKGFCFPGVCLEKIIAEKIVLLTSDLSRPVKHLIDLYGLIHLDFDAGKVRTFLIEGLEQENAVRERHGAKPIEPTWEISMDKELTGSYFLEAIAGGYTLTKQEMVNSINEKLSKLR